MPRWKAEAKKREEEKKAGAKKPQSSSVKNVNNKAQNSTFMGGGAPVKKAEKTYQIAKRPSAKARQVAEEQKRRRELEQHQNQKTYGDQKRATPRRTTSTSNNLTQHTTAAQRQKMGMPTAEDLREGREHRRALANNVKDSVRRATSEENKSFMQRQKSGIQTEADRQYSEKLNQRRAEVAKNTGRAATKGVQDTLTGYGKTLADVDEMAKSNKNWTKAKASKMGISEDDTVGMAKVEAERQESIKQAQELRRDLAEKQEKRQAEFDERTKNAKGLEKAWYGAVESGTGMATDALVGALTGTGTAGSLASMAVRTYGTTRGQAEKEGATENEDRAYAVLQAAKEVGTELMFPGAGLAKKTYGNVGLSVADRVANKLTKGMTGNKADLVGAGVRLLGGTAEENAEELAGWGLDPVIKELAYGKNVRTREAQKLLKQESDELRSNLKSADDARSVAAYLGSDRFLADNIAQYKDAGLSDKQAREVAEKMRDYLTASLTGDTDRMGDLEDEIVTTVAGGSLKAMIKEYDVGELMDTFASTSVLTLATGLPATATTAMKGARIRENLGSEGLRALSQTAINFEDDEASLKGQAARDRLDSGKDLTSTQVFDLAKAQAEQIQKDEKRVAAMSNMADNAIKSEKLVTPKIGFRENGSVAGDEIITMNYVNESNNATEIISDLLKEEGSESLTDTEVQTGSRAIAGFKTGAFTVNDANALNYTNTTVRTAFEAATGVNLSQYVVRKNGQVDIPATNAATKDALFAMAADNFVKTAQAETANWMDSVKGDVVTQVTERMGAQGSLALQQALDDVDERDRSTYMMNANAADMMYQTARNMGTEWDSVKAEARKMFPDISETKLEAMYNAGLRDRADAANGAIGQQVKMGEAMALQNEPSEPKGKVFVDTTATPKGTVVRTFSEIASNLGVDIHLVDDLKTSTGGQANGQYVNGAIYINMNSDFESNIGYIFMHEVTHHLKQYAPEQFNELENLVREKWFGYNPEQMQNEIAKKIDLYKRNGQTLSEEEALEEIIADAAHEFINDRNFADQVAEQNPDIAKAILNGIRNALRMLRRLFASGSIDDETHMNSLFSQLNILDEAEKLWLNAYTQAVQNKAAVAIDEWQDRANKASISESANTYYNEDTPIEDLDQHNATVEDDNGDMVAEFQDNGSVRFSISSFDDKGRAIYKKYLNKMVKTGEMSQQEADDMMNELETVYKICKDFADKVDDKGNPVFAPYTSWSYADVVTDEKGKPVFSAIKKNSEYKMNIDFSTICKKRRTLDAVFREMINRGLMEQLDFNKDESAAMVVNINNLIRQNDFEAACALCFVEARRYRQQQTATTFRDMWNDLVESMYKDKSKIAYFNFGKDSTVEDVPDGIHTMDAKDLDLTHIKEIANARKEDGKLMQTAEAKAARLILKDPSQRKLMRIGDMMASTGFENMQIQNPKLMKIYNAKKGTGGAKSSFGDVQYLNEIINSKTFDRRKAYAVSGVRIQSFSDYVPRMVFDYVQVIADLAAKKLPAHAYTKEVLFAQQFGLTGAKINLSLVPDVVADGVAPGLDAQGNYIWNEEGTFPFDEAMRLQEAEGYKENCGTIAVGISDEQIIKMLADPKIQMVIPYHKSSLNPIVAAMTNVDRFENYEKFQTTKDENGNALSKDFDWDNKLFELSHNKNGNQLPKEQWGNVQDLVKEYADWCKEHNYTPKFPQFLYMEDGSINPGYYKLLEDFALLDNKGNFKPQGDVQMRFPTEADEFGSMQSLIEQGLTEDTELEANRTAKIGGIVDRIKEMMDEGTLAEQSTTSEKLAAKFSISETDADGNVLTNGQMEYFKNSQARDAEGRLVPVYHTTNKGGFTIFDPSYSEDGRSIFFTDSEAISKTYGTKDSRTTYECYLNLENPMIVDADYNAWDRIPITRQVGNISLTEDYDTNEVSRIAFEAGYDGVIIRNCRDWAVDDSSEFDTTENSPYSTIFIAFSSNQVKDINNENPTENPDIRYSIPDEEETMNLAQDKAKTTDDVWATDPVAQEGRIRKKNGKQDFINGVTNKWNPAWKTEGKVLKDSSVEKAVRDVIMGAMRESNTTARYRQSMVKKTMLVARQAFNMMKNDEYAKAAELLYDHAYDMIENLEFFGNDDKSEFERYKELREYLRTTKITVPEDKRSDIDYASFRKKNFGKILLGDGGTAPDVAWQRLNELWPEVFTEDIKGDAASIMLQMENALNIYEPYATAYSSEQCVEFAGDLADSLYDIIYEGEEYKSLADRYDDKAKAMKQRHQEAMTKMRERLGQKDSEYEELKKRYQYDTAYLKAQKEKAVKEVKEKNKQKDKEKRERQNHRALYNKVLEEYNGLTHKLLHPTKDKSKNIPEQLRQPLAQMLHCFDLEKERSKELEQAYMIPTRSQLNFRELKDSMEKVIKEDPTAYELSDVHKYMADKMIELADRVDGKTIDYLDSADIQTIYDLLKGISEGIKNGQQLEIDGENYQKQQMCDKVGEGAAEHQKLYGKAKKYGSNDRPGIRAYADHILNMGELTPIYFFRQIKGMYDMYRQMRKGFNTYVRNEKNIINKIADILSDYYKTNRKGERIQGSEIEEWRHSESAETFPLMIGNQTITLTIAQKMSLYCLAKRSQAQMHMYSENGGIVASETSAGSKIHQAEERYKGKTVEYKPVYLTPADVDAIISTLTEDQKTIADQLQKLMSTDMAELGNEASVKLTGIEMYKEQDYFPIKVMGESLPTNPENIGIREKIRNPGFSNPLQENASNPIIVDDIFAVVASHCNEMNQYASYAVPITNFMKVYNGSVINEEGKAVKIKTVLKETYGEKALTYIENFIDDINGNSFKRHGGIDDVLDKVLGQAKKAAVFANLRVALQQPTAIIRALAVMNPKYFMGVHPSTKATKEMIEHCPIAQWKALGYFDTHFGRDIEDVMMGRDVSSKGEQLMSEIYGQLDNMTWGMIWQAVKNEVKATHKGIDETSQEFWDLCEERASFVFDSTQVVDSPFHRSNDMRSKDRFVKQLTSFQAEPTLSFNVLRQGFVDAYEALKKGDSKKARRIVERVLGVWVAQALTVALAQSIVDALRRKGHKKKDDEEDEMLTWYQEFVKYFFRNFGNNFKDDLNPINNIYFVKDIVPPIMNAIKGEYVYGTQSLTTQWVDTLTNGISMCKKKWEKGDADSHTWYDCLTELFGGLGYLKGIPAKTMMRGTKNAFHWAGKIFGINVFADDGKAVDKAVDSFVDNFRGDESESEGGGLFDSIANKMGYRKSEESSGDTEESKADSADIDAKLKDYEESLSDTYTDKQKKNLVKQYKKTLEKEAVTEAAMSEDFDVQAHIAEAQANFDYEMEKRSLKAAEMAAGKTGRQRDEALWDVISEGYTKSVDSGNMATIQRMREEFAKQGGDTEWFDAKIADKMKSAYKKTIYSSDEIVPGASLRQETMYNFMTEHGVSEKEISDIVYHSYVARDLKAAMRIGNEDYILDELVPLVAAGLSREDYEKLYKYRNMGAKTYDGKYTDQKYTKTTGTFVWPTEGVITSHFGWRNAPTAGASSNHPAIDIGAPSGTTVVAADGGVVITAGANGGYGNSVGIKHANGMVTYYNHLSAWNVKVGDQVAQGQPIANVGSTGISTGPHLDFKILDADGNPVDPEKYLNKR